MDMFSTSIPDVVLLSSSLTVTAKHLYAVLLQQSKGSEFRCRFTLAEICRLTHLSKETVIRQMQALIDAGLVTRLGRGEYLMRHEGAESWVTLLDQVIKRLKRAEHYAQQLMLEDLSILIPSDKFEDNARVAESTNPLTGERLEFDRFYYEARVAFEFNGDQHYGTTLLYPSSEGFRRRRANDLTKRGLCAENGISLVIITRDDLSLAGIRVKIGNLLPLREGVEDSPVGRFLEQECSRFRRTTPKSYLTETQPKLDGQPAPGAQPTSEAAAKPDTQDKRNK